MQGTGLGDLDLIRRMRSHEPSTCILVFSMHNDPMIAARKRALPVICLKIRPQTLAMRVALLRTGMELNPLVDLTPRQSQIFSLLAKGKTYSGITEELGVSYKIVVNTCLHLKRTLGAKNLPVLIRDAVRLLPTKS
jgi:two-component system invasion response regulator UvrY